MKRILFILAVSVISLSGCSTKAFSKQLTSLNADDTTKLKMSVQIANDADIQQVRTESFPLTKSLPGNVKRWIDPDTGVEYLYLESAGTVKAITVRYDSEGKVIVHKKDKPSDIGDLNKEPNSIQ